MRIQFFSDIHLEFGPCELSSVNADVLIAAGDIHTGIWGLDWLAQADCPVVYIAGNHEYYGGDIVYTLSDLRSQAADFDIHFLENDVFTINNTRILGTTLWTDFNNGSRENMDFAEWGMNDYNYISKKDVLLRSKDLLRIHQKSRQWLFAELDKPYKGKTIIVTHHAPSCKSWYGKDEIQRMYSYCNNLDDVIRNYQIDLWIHGHIHAVSDYKIGEVRVVCNPRGYHDYQTIPGFAVDKVIEI